MKVFITGVVGFIGYNLATELLKDKNNKVYGIDSLDNYYSVELKKKRLNNLKKNKNFFFKRINICNFVYLKKFTDTYKFDIAINLAAQAGVRYSLINPQKYLSINIYGFLNFLRIFKAKKVKKIFYASSSSVYGENKNFPIKETEKLNPKNLYGLTKKFNEVIAQEFSQKNKIPIVGLRFFTVYGEWGRPDMFLLKLFKSLTTKKIMYVNNFGNHDRDFTYIGDLVNILKLLFKKNFTKHEIYNICSNNPVNIDSIIKSFQNNWKFKLKYKKMVKADVLKTHGSNKKIIKVCGYKKFTPINLGIKKTLDWYIKENIHNL
jgi:UDP-glucuronate 4-epimerase